MRSILASTVGRAFDTRTRVVLSLAVGAAVFAGAPSVALAGTKTPSGHRAAPARRAHIAFLSDASVILPATGARYQLSAVVKNATGHVLRRRLTWRSSSPRLASVSKSGLLTAHVAVGSATITVASPGVEPVAADVIVAPPAPHTVLIPSSAVISAGRMQVALRANPTTRAIRAGDTVVSGSTGGVLAYARAASTVGGVVHLRTGPASLARAFARLDVHSTGARQTGVLVVHGGSVSLSAPGGAPIGQVADDEELPCDSDRSGDLKVSLSGASMEAPVSFEPYANLKGGLLSGGVQLFELGVRVDVPVSLSTGSVQIAAAGEGSVTCELTLPLSLPSPLWIGPVEIAPTLTPSVGARIDGQASGSLTVAGPTLNETVAANDGVRWTPQGGWQAIADNSSSTPTLEPGGTHFAGDLSASIDPFVHVDAGFSAELFGLFSLQDVNLAYVDADGELSLSMQAPFGDLQAGYTGPSWGANATLSAGPELVLGEGALSDLWKAIGLDPPNAQWSLYSQSWPLASSPGPRVSAAPATLTSGSLALTAAIPKGAEAVAGDEVQFVGYKDGSREGRLLASGMVGSESAAGATASASWFATAEDDGSWHIVALLFDPIFGPLDFPYASSQPATVTVQVPSGGGSGVLAIAPGSFKATPATVGSGGGQTTLTASVENATSCQLSASPAIPGLPTSTSCSTGTVSIPVTLPANGRESPVDYTLTLIASGATGTTSATASTSVTVQGRESSSTPPGQSLETAIAPAESIALPANAEQYFYVGSTAGGHPMESITWLQDLAVTAAYSGNEAVSIGRSNSDTGSYGSASGNHVIAGVALSGYTVVRTFSAHASETGPGYSGGPETPAPGVSLDLPFTTEPGDIVLILVGGEGTGELNLSGIGATALQNATYSEAGSQVLASAAIYTATLSAGSYTAHWDSTTYLTNSGSSLGAVAYVLRPS